MNSAWERVESERARVDYLRARCADSLREAAAANESLEERVRAEHERRREAEADVRTLRSENDKLRRRQAERSRYDV